MIDQLRKIGQNLHTQDNRITDAPMFIVQQKVRDYGYADEYTDKWEWISRGETIDNPRLAARLDRIWEDGDRDCLKHKYYKVGFKDRWEFVTACFTEQGCKDYLAQDRHNLGREVRIYAAGSYRNVEFRAVRDFLMDIGTIQKDTLREMVQILDTMALVGILNKEVHKVYHLLAAHEVSSFREKARLEHTVAAQLAEITDLKAQVERAYQNGHGDGYAEGVGAV